MKEKTSNNGKFNVFLTFILLSFISLFLTFFVYVTLILKISIIEFFTDFHIYIVKIFSPESFFFLIFFVFVFFFGYFIFFWNENVIKLQCKINKKKYNKETKQCE